MASAMALKLSCAVLLCMIVGAPVATAAITCAQVSSSLKPCISYLTGDAILPPGADLPPGCCDGARSLNSAATTSADRQEICFCLNGFAESIDGGINYSKAADIPGRCGFVAPYYVIPYTDCSKY